MFSETTRKKIAELQDKLFWQLYWKEFYKKQYEISSMFLKKMKNNDEEDFEDIEDEV